MPNKDEIREYKEKKILSKAYIIGSIISFIVCSIICISIFCLQYYSSSQFLYLALIDGFTISGFLMMLFYLLVKLSDKGAFDILSYSVKVVIYSVFYKNIRESKLPSSYHEYKELKHSKPKLKVSYMFIIGIVFLIVGLILFIPYYQFRP